MGTVILTWNIQWGRGVDGHADIARQLAEAHAMASFDVLCLQEVTSGFGRLPGHPSADQWGELADRLGPQYSVIGGFALERHDGNHVQRFGNAIATRLPVLHVTRHALPCPPDTTPTMPRMAIEAIVQAPFGPLRVVTTHLEYYSEVQRLAQVDTLRAIHAEGCARGASIPAWPRARGGAVPPVGADRCHRHLRRPQLQTRVHAQAIGHPTVHT